MLAVLLPQHQLMGELCIKWSNILGCPSLTLPLKMLCWNPLGSVCLFGHKPPITQTCIKPFSAPDSSIWVCLSSLCIGHIYLCLVTVQAVGLDPSTNHLSHLCFPVQWSFLACLCVPLELPSWQLCSFTIFFCSMSSAQVFILSLCAYVYAHALLPPLLYFKFSLLKYVINTF